jgi:hypothetical protein
VCWLLGCGSERAELAQIRRDGFVCTVSYPSFPGDPAVQSTLRIPGNQQDGVLTAVWSFPKQDVPQTCEPPDNDDDTAFLVCARGGRPSRTGADWFEFVAVNGKVEASHCHTTINAYFRWPCVASNR